MNEENKALLEATAEELIGNLQNTEIELVDEDEKHEPAIYNPQVSVTPTKPMTALEIQVCELYASSKSTSSIADTLGIDASTVRNILSKPHIKEFVKELVNAQYTTAIEGRLRIINGIIDAKLEKIEQEYDGDLAYASKKDLVDLLVIADNMLKERQKKELGTSDNVYLSIINQITGE